MSGRGALRALAQGATFGWGDELSSAMAATLAASRGAKFGDAYGDIVRSERSGRAEFERDNPWSSFGLELLGGLPTGMGAVKALGKAAPKVAAGAPAARRIARWAATSPVAQGATLGAAAGAGAADTDATAGGTAVGAAVGAATGKAGDLAIRGLKKLAEVAGIRDLTKTVVDDLLTAMKADGLDPAKVLTELGNIAGRTNKSLTFADMVAEIQPGEHTRKLLDGALSRAGSHRGRVETFLADRLAGQKESVVDDIANATGHFPQAARDTIEQLIERRKKDTSDLYRKAFSNRARLNTPELQALHKSGAMDDAMKAVMEELRIRGETLPVRWATAAELPDIPKALLTGQEAVRGRTPYYSPTLEHYHSMKRHLWDLAEKAKVAGPFKEAKATQLSMAYDDARRNLQQLLKGDGQTVGIGGPEYARAEALFGGESKLIEAAVLGRDLFKTDPAKLRGILTRMDPAEREAVLVGFGGYVEGLPANERSDFVRRLIGDSEKMKRLEALFSHDPAAYRSLLERLRTTSQMTNAASAYPAAVRPSSPHAALWAGARALRGDPKGGAVDYAKHWFEFPHPRYAERTTEFAWGRPGASDFAGIEEGLRKGLPDVRFSGLPGSTGGMGGLWALPRQDNSALSAPLGELPGE